MPMAFSLLKAFAHLDPLEEAPGHVPQGAERLQNPGGPALPPCLRAGLWSSSLQPRKAAMASAAERPRRARKRISGVCWVPSAVSSSGHDGRVSGNLVCLFKHTQPELG